MYRMQLDRLTIKSQEALKGAQDIAHQYSHQEIDSEHLLLSLLSQADSLIPDLLAKVGAAPANVRSDLERELERRHKVQGSAATELFLSNDLKKALDAAQGEAARLKDEYISTEHLLLGLLEAGGATLQRNPGPRGDCVGIAILRALAELRGNQRVTDPNPRDKFQALDKYRTRHLDTRWRAREKLTR